MSIMPGQARRTKQVMLSFDLEEFDIPLEYGQAIPMEEQLAVGRAGAVAVLAMLDELGLTATFFTTAHFAQHHRDLMRQIAAGHEVASHGFAHSRFENADLLRSREVLEEIVDQPVRGFRRARFAPTDPDAIHDAGYVYNSSINPIWLPGRYNHFFSPRRAYFAGELLNIPISASPVVRFPLFWLSMKNFPPAVMKSALRATLFADGYLNFFFHPWEFVDLSAYALPRLVKRRDGEAMTQRVAMYLRWLAKRAEFVTMEAFAQQLSRSSHS